MGPMAFALLDRILQLESGKQLTAIKSPTLSEEYLQDHFPLFPVMPGVMMLEAMSQAAAWLTREHDGFAYSMVLLKEARAIKYSGFVQPGQTLKIRVDLQNIMENRVSFKARGTVDDKLAVSGRLVLERYNLSDKDPAAVHLDEYIRNRFKRDFQILFPSSPSIAG